MSEERLVKPTAVRWDWYEFLNREEISEFEWNVAFEWARSWYTCPCGCLGDSIERIPAMKDAAPIMPADKQLEYAGLEFTKAILLMNKAEAIKRLNSIEARAKELNEKHI